MSENMKKIYQAYADSIAPAPDMQERLKRQLYAEMQGERPRKRNYGRGQFSRWLVVACVLFLVSGGCLIYAVMGTSRQTGRADGRWIIGADTGGTRLLGGRYGYRTISGERKAMDSAGDAGTRFCHSVLQHGRWQWGRKADAHVGG